MASAASARLALVLACGALAREVLALVRANGWQRAIVLQCLPADLHNRPQQIVPRLRARLDTALASGRYRRVLVGYGDCGTGGLLDDLLADYRRRGCAVERLPGAHCYALFAGLPSFDRLAASEPGSFYLTDFLARHFQRLVWQGLGLDRHPELLSVYFGHYRRLVYLAQTDDPSLNAAAEAAAERLGLRYRRLSVGYGQLLPALAEAAA